MLLLWWKIKLLAISLGPMHSSRHASGRRKAPCTQLLFLDSHAAATHRVAALSFSFWPPQMHNVWHVCCTVIGIPVCAHA